jgi:putative chitinase
MTISQVFATILLGGLMGLFGQGIRAVVGLKTMVDYAGDQEMSESALFSAARLIISLVIGFLAGIAATLTLGIKTLMDNPGDLHTLLGIAAAGYAGTDAIEGFISKYLPSGKSKPESAPPSAASQNPKPDTAR